MIYDKLENLSSFFPGCLQLFLWRTLLLIPCCSEVIRGLGPLYFSSNFFPLTWEYLHMKYHYKKCKLECFPVLHVIKSSTFVIKFYDFFPHLHWKMKVPSTVFFQTFPLEFLSLLFSIPYFFMEIALFSLLKIHGTQFSLEYIGPKAFNHVYVIA